MATIVISDLRQANHYSEPFDADRGDQANSWWWSAQPEMVWLQGMHPSVDPGMLASINSYVGSLFTYGFSELAAGFATSSVTAARPTGSVFISDLTSAPEDWKQEWDATGPWKLPYDPPEGTQAGYFKMDDATFRLIYEPLVETVTTTERVNVGSSRRPVWQDRVVEKQVQTGVTVYELEKALEEESRDVWGDPVEVTEVDLTADRWVFGEGFTISNNWSSMEGKLTGVQFASVDLRWNDSVSLPAGTIGVASPAAGSGSYVWLENSSAEWQEILFDIDFELVKDSNGLWQGPEGPEKLVVGSFEGDSLLEINNPFTGNSFWLAEYSSDWLFSDANPSWRGMTAPKWDYLFDADYVTKVETQARESFANPLDTSQALTSGSTDFWGLSGDDHILVQSSALEPKSWWQEPAHPTPDTWDQYYFIFSGAGQDTVFGSDGREIIDGGTGTDILYGNWSQSAQGPVDGEPDIFIVNEQDKVYSTSYLATLDMPWNSQDVPEGGPPEGNPLYNFDRLIPFRQSNTDPWDMSVAIFDATGTGSTAYTLNNDAGIDLLIAAGKQSGTYEHAGSVFPGYYAMEWGASPRIRLMNEGSVDLANDRLIQEDHGLETGYFVRYEADEFGPSDLIPMGGLVDGNVYYVEKISDAEFSLYFIDEQAEDLRGSKVDLTSFESNFVKHDFELQYVNGRGEDWVSFQDLRDGGEQGWALWAEWAKDRYLTDDLDLTGNDQTQIILGNDGANRLSGLGGDDELFGLEGDDVLDGGDGNDVLLAGAGNDTVIGGAGDDVMLMNIGTLLDARNLHGFDIELSATGGHDYFQGGSGYDVLNVIVRYAINDATGEYEALETVERDGFEIFTELTAFGKSYYSELASEPRLLADLDSLWNITKDGDRWFSSERVRISQVEEVVSTAATFTFERIPGAPEPTLFVPDDVFDEGALYRVGNGTSLDVASSLAIGLIGTDDNLRYQDGVFRPTAVDEYYERVYGATDLSELPFMVPENALAMEWKGWWSEGVPVPAFGQGTDLSLFSLGDMAESYSYGNSGDRSFVISYFGGLESLDSMLLEQAAPVSSSLESPLAYLRWSGVVSHSEGIDTDGAELLYELGVSGNEGFIFEVIPAGSWRNNGGGDESRTIAVLPSYDLSSPWTWTDGQGITRYPTDPSKTLVIADAYDFFGGPLGGNQHVFTFDIEGATPDYYGFVTLATDLEVNQSMAPSLESALVEIRPLLPNSIDLQANDIGLSGSMWAPSLLVPQQFFGVDNWESLRAGQNMQSTIRLSVGDSYSEVVDVSLGSDGAWPSAVRLTLMTDDELTSSELDARWAELQGLLGDPTNAVSIDFGVWFYRNSVHDTHNLVISGQSDDLVLDVGGILDFGNINALSRGDDSFVWWNDWELRQDERHAPFYPEVVDYVIENQVMDVTYVNQSASDPDLDGLQSGSSYVLLYHPTLRGWDGIGSIAIAEELAITQAPSDSILYPTDPYGDPSFRFSVNSSRPLEDYMPGDWYAEPSYLLFDNRIGEFVGQNDHQSYVRVIPSGTQGTDLELFLQFSTRDIAGNQADNPLAVSGIDFANNQIFLKNHGLLTGSTIEFGSDFQTFINYQNLGYNPYSTSEPISFFVEKISEDQLALYFDEDLLQGVEFFDLSSIQIQDPRSLVTMPVGFAPYTWAPSPQSISVSLDAEALGSIEEEFYLESLGGLTVGPQSFSSQSGGWQGQSSLTLYLPANEAITYWNELDSVDSPFQGADLWEVQEVGNRVWFEPDDSPETPTPEFLELEVYFDAQSTQWQLNDKLDGQIQIEGRFVTPEVFDALVEAELVRANGFFDYEDPRDQVLGFNYPYPKLFIPLEKTGQYHESYIPLLSENPGQFRYAFASDLHLPSDVLTRLVDLYEVEELSFNNGQTAGPVEVKLSWAPAYQWSTWLQVDLTQTPVGAKAANQLEIDRVNNLFLNSDLEFFLEIDSVDKTLEISFENAQGYARFDVDQYQDGFYQDVGFQYFYVDEAIFDALDSLELLSKRSVNSGVGFLRYENPSANYFNSKPIVFIDASVVSLEAEYYDESVAFSASDFNLAENFSFYQTLEFTRNVEGLDAFITFDELMSSGASGSPFDGMQLLGLDVLNEAGQPRIDPVFTFDFYSGTSSGDVIRIDEMVFKGETSEGGVSEGGNVDYGISLGTDGVEDKGPYGEPNFITVAAEELVRVETARAKAGAGALEPWYLDGDTGNDLYEINLIQDRPEYAGVRIELSDAGGIDTLNVLFNNQAVLPTWSSDLAKLEVGVVSSSTADSGYDAGTGPQPLVVPSLAGQTLSIESGAIEKLLLDSASLAGVADGGNKTTTFDTGREYWIGSVEEDDETDAVIGVGGAGDDVLLQVAGREVHQFGGAGDDLIYVNASQGSSASGGEGFNTLVLMPTTVASSSPSTDGDSAIHVPTQSAWLSYEDAKEGAYAEVYLAAGIGILYETDASGEDQLLGVDMLESQVLGQGWANVVGTSGDDLLNGDKGANQLVGGAGDDRLYGGLTLIEDASVGEVIDVLSGGQGNDRFIVSSNSKAMTVIEEASDLSGGTDDRVLIDLSASKIDQLVSSWEGGTVLGIKAVGNTDNADTEDDQVVTNLFKVENRFSVERIGFSEDLFSASEPQVEYHRLAYGAGSSQSEIILTGKSGNAFFVGGGGQDIMLDASFDDIYVGGSSTDLMYALMGRDRVIAGGGDDDIYVGLGRDNRDIVLTGQGKDTVHIQLSEENAASPMLTWAADTTAEQRYLDIAEQALAFDEVSKVFDFKTDSDRIEIHFDGEHPIVDIHADTSTGIISVKDADSNIYSVVQITSMIGVADPTAFLNQVHIEGFTQDTTLTQFVNQSEQWG